jgi:hypothetical protein
MKPNAAPEPTGARGAELGAVRAATARGQRELDSRTGGFPSVWKGWGRQSRSGSTYPDPASLFDETLNFEPIFDDNEWISTFDSVTVIFDTLMSQIPFFDVRDGCFDRCVLI